MAKVNAKSRCWKLQLKLKVPFSEHLPRLGAKQIKVYTRQGEDLQDVWYKFPSQQRATYFSSLDDVRLMLPVSAEDFKDQDTCSDDYVFGIGMDEVAQIKEEHPIISIDSDTDASQDTDPITTPLDVSTTPCDRMPQNEAEGKTATLSTSEETLCNEVVQWLQQQRGKKREAQEEIERATKKIKTLQAVIQDRQRFLKSKTDMSALLRLSNAV